MVTNEKKRSDYGFLAKKQEYLVEFTVGELTAKYFLERKVADSGTI